MYECRRSDAIYEGSLWLKQKFVHLEKYNTGYRGKLSNFSGEPSVSSLCRSYFPDITTSNQSQIIY